MSIFIFLIIFFAFIFSYFIYGGLLNKIFEVDKNKKTPAYNFYDGIDYVPAKNWLVLFGHHFSSIAGAGPIIGPIIAVMLWGWLPAILWVVFGTIFIGGVHDFGSLIVSVKEDGATIADISKKIISKRAKIIFSLFVWFALILVIAVFAYLCADTFTKSPEIILPSLGLIPVALIVGYLLYKTNLNSFLITVFGIVCLGFLIFLGKNFIVKLDINFWLVVLFIYAFFASILPVNILLQPRDYISSFLLFFGLTAGIFGLFLARPKITMPAFISFNTTDGFLWPMMFVTVACGAISGFHSLISSGTTSKQISSQLHAKKIGYGAMIAEGLLATVVIFAIASLFRKNYNFYLILKTQGPVAIFGEGFSMITKNILGNFGKILPITILNAFILTTLDTATRITRYLTEELFKLKNRYLSTFLVIIASAILAFSKKWQAIWPIFGASNQLVAALTLFVLSSWLLLKKKHSTFTLIPAFFMFITTVSALILQFIKYFKNKEILLVIIDLILIVLAFFMLFEVFYAIRRRYGK
ncbi:MAG: carbon starvation protein A [Candidatus Omnitrophica bacterium]|nr:carbon starvation protein A [Candidatus Omnitrophota bacterium]